MADRFQIECEGNGLLFVGLATGERLADGTDDGTLATVMGILVVAYTVAADEISLILHRTGSCENLPGVLTTLRPVRHGNDGIVGQGVRITAPDGETQVVTGQKQDAETTVFYDGMGRARLIITVFMAVSEEVVFIIIGLVARTTVDEIMTIDKILSFEL